MGILWYNKKMGKDHSGARELRLLILLLTLMIELHEI